MKKLILYDHQGNKLLEQDVFVEGQDFMWESSKPTAFWLGKVMIVDKELEPEPKVEGIVGVNTLALIESLEEVKVEPEKVDNPGARDAGSSEASEPESVEGLPKESAGGEPAKGSKRARKPEAA